MKVIGKNQTNPEEEVDDVARFSNPRIEAFNIPTRWSLQPSVAVSEADLGAARGAQPAVRQPDQPVHRPGLQPERRLLPARHLRRRRTIELRGIREPGLAIYSPKDTGATKVSDSFSDFWYARGGLPKTDAVSFLSDPIVTYDDQVGRFIVGDQDVDPNTLKSKFDIAVSKTSSPTTLTTTDWNFYQISTTQPGFDADYPGNFGYNHDAFVFTLNMFPAIAGFHVLVTSINMADLVNGVPQSSLHVSQNNFDGASLRPTVMHDSKVGDPMWLIQEVGDGQQVQVVKMTGVLSSSASFSRTDLPVNQYSDVSSAYPLNPDGTPVTTNIDSRIQKSAEANNTIVACARRVGLEHRG